MTTSGTETFMMDSNSICTQALKRLGVVTFGNQPRIEDIVTAQTELNMMVKNWRADGVQLWKSKWAVIPFTPSNVVQGSDGTYYECIRGHVASAANKPVTGAEYLGFWKATTVPTATEIENSLVVPLFDLETSATTPTGAVTTGESMVLPTGTVTTAHGYNAAYETFAADIPFGKCKVSMWVEVTTFPGALGPPMAVFGLGGPTSSPAVLLTCSKTGAAALTILKPDGNPVFSSVVGAFQVGVPTYIEIIFDDATGAIFSQDGVETAVSTPWTSFSFTTGTLGFFQGTGYEEFIGKLYGVAVYGSSYVWTDTTSYNSICNPQLDASILGTDKRIIGIGNAFLRNDQSQDSYINSHLQAYEYFRMGNKINPGRPTMIYFKRNPLVDELFVYPYPDTNTWVLNVELYYYPDDFTDPTDNPDFLMEWEAALVDGLTVRLYSVFPGRSRVALTELSAIFQDSYQRAKAGDSEKGELQCVPDFWLNNGRY